VKGVSQRGFTVVELLIATTVFSIVLLTALIGFIRIGNLFYKGVSIAQTQDNANSLYKDVAGNFQSAASVGGAQNSISGTYDYYCIGGTRYTYRINKEVLQSDPLNHSPSGNFGVLKDILPGNGACAEPCDDTSSSPCLGSTVRLSNPVELLGEKTRIEKFNITQSTTTSNLYTIAIILAYGDDTALDYSIKTPAVDYSTVFCPGGTTSQQFCAISSVDTAIYRGWHQ
jgi:prepilin-type N-terminal cleavage/methylation domain-containing protein